MPKAFNMEQKNNIRARILSAGLELFSRYGIKKTNVSEITNLVGIAKGTFYNFYKSKEDLFFELLENEEKNLKQGLLDLIENKELNRETLREYLIDTLEYVEKNSLLSHLFYSGEYNQLVNNLTPGRLEKHLSNDEEDSLFLIKSMQSQGFSSEMEPEVVTALLRSVFLISLHRNEIGEDVYDEVIRNLVKYIVNGIFGIHEPKRDYNDQS